MKIFVWYLTLDNAPGVIAVSALDLRQARSKARKLASKALHDPADLARAAHEVSPVENFSMMVVQ